MKKRMLSLLLIMCMTISLLPTVSYAETTEKSGYKAVYDFNYINGANDTSGTLLNTVTDYAAASGMWRWNDSTAQATKTHNWGIVSSATKEGQWFAVDINVPAAGKYDVSVSHGMSTSNGGYGKLYILPAGTKDIAAALETAEPVGGEIAYYTSGTKNISSTTTELGTRYFDEGECIAVFVATRQGAKSYYMHIGSLTLDGGGKPFLIGVKLEVVGNIASAAALMSDGTKADLSSAEVVYSIDNTSAGSIDAKSGRITPSAEGGTATVSVSVTLDNITVTDEVTVELEPEVIIPSGDSIIYNFTQVSNWSVPVGSGNDVTGIKYENTDGNWQWHMSNASGAGLGVVYSGGSGARLRFKLGNVGTWAALKIKVPAPGAYWATLTSLVRELSSSSGTIAGIYVLPVSDDADGITKSLGIGTGKVAEVKFYDDSYADWQQVKNELGVVKFDDAGEYLLVFKREDSEKHYATPFSLELNGENILRTVNMTLKKTVYEVGEKAAASFVAKIMDGTEIDASELSVVYATDNEDVAVFEDGIVTAVGKGTATVSVSVTYEGVTVTASENIIVNDTSGIKRIYIDSDGSAYVGERMKLTAYAEYNSGSIVKLSDEDVVYTVAEGSAEADGTYVTASAEGVIKVTASSELEGAMRESEPFEISVLPASQKTEPTYYTYDMRTAAQANVKKYDWARKLADTAEGYSEKYVENLDKLYEGITGEGLPRSRQVGAESDPDYAVCRYCGVNIEDKHGGFTADVYSRPWKIQCPDCKRTFPSNDFSKFYELGVDRAGYFDVDRARQNHHIMLFHADSSECIHTAPTEKFSEEWYEFYGYGNEKGYLYNSAYSEVVESNKDPRTGADVDGARWGVDDGLGYLPGRTYSNGVEERHSYIAYYVHEMWIEIQRAVKNLTNAYVYTGDIKYGRAGAILVDRIADVFSSFSYRQWDNMYLVTHGGTGYGKIMGRIMDCEYTTIWILGADAFYPMYEDEYVINYLSEKAEGMGLENPKTSKEKIWANIEDGILRETFDACKDIEIYGNYGLQQYCLSAAALVLASEPESKEMIDWVFRSGGRIRYGDGTESCSGGNLGFELVDNLDRDGMGDEGSPNYNIYWLESLYECADVLDKYSSDEKYNLYKNPKFAKMFTAGIPLALVDTHTAQIGDSGSTAGIEFEDSMELLITGFKHLKDTSIGNELAEYIYRRNGYSAEGLYYDIYDSAPESLENDVLARIDDDVSRLSEMMTGFGFAVLRDGAKYGGEGSSTYTNNMRDFWITFGGSTLSHSHHDVLNLGIDAFGLDMAPEMAYPEVSSVDPNRYQWTNKGPSHNIVTVNEKAQTLLPYSEKPLHFDDSGEVKVMDIDASDVYDETSVYRRTLVMINAGADVSYGVDFYRVKGGDHHLYSFHSQSDEIYETEGLGDISYQTDDGTAAGNYIGSYAGADVSYGKDPSNSTKEAEFIYPAGYTWLKNIRRSDNVNHFAVDFKVTDFRKVLRDGKGLHLRMTMLNDFALDEVALASGYVLQKTANAALPDTFEYVLAKREGKDLDSLFTTVYEPYRNERYLSDMNTVDIAVKYGEEGKNDTAKAVKVVRIGENGEAGRCDYIVYATNNDVLYTVTDGDVSFDFRGFVGVYSLNASGKVIYSYIHDGDIIGERKELDASIDGKVSDFTKTLELENSITFSTAEEVDVSSLPGKYVFVQNDGEQNGVYEIKSAENTDGGIKLNIGAASPIRRYKDSTDASKGFVYNIARGQYASIPLSNIESFAPEFDSVSDNLTTSAGSSITVSLNAKSEVKNADITYIGTTLPRGASIDAESGAVTWKPDSSQVGENHFAVTAKDSDGRETTVHFIVTVYGSTTSSGNKMDSDGTSTGTSGGGSSGQGSTDGSDTGTTDKTDNGDTSDQTGENAPDASGETERLRFTDLGNHSWAADSINALADAGIVRGTTATTYSPAANITRADFALLLVRAFNLESDNAENFADVAADDYFAPELAIARNTGIVNGIGDNKYAPRNTITRQDMMVIVYRALTTNPEKMPSLPKGSEAKWNVDAAMNDSPVDYQNRGVTEPGEKGTVEDGGGIQAPADGTASDTEREPSPVGEGGPLSTDEALLSERYGDWDNVAPYARDAVSYLISNGLVNGKSGLIAPLEYTTRAEVAVLLKRILEYKASLA